MVRWENDDQRERNDGTEHHTADQPAEPTAGRPSGNPSARADEGGRGTQPRFEDQGDWFCHEQPAGLFRLPRTYRGASFVDGRPLVSRPSLTGT